MVCGCNASTMHVILECFCNKVYLTKRCYIKCQHLYLLLVSVKLILVKFTARDASSPAHASSSPLGGSTSRLRVSTFCVLPLWNVCTQLHEISVLMLQPSARADLTDTSHTYKSTALWKWPCQLMSNLNIHGTPLDKIMQNFIKASEASRAQELTLIIIQKYLTVANNVSSIMGCDDSWPATMPSVVPTGDCSHWSTHYIHKANRPHFYLNGQSAKLETPKMAKPYFQSWIWWQILKWEAYLHFIVTIRLVWEIFVCDRQADGRRNNAVHYYSWPRHCGGTAKKYIHIYVKSIHTWNLTKRQKQQYNGKESNSRSWLQPICRAVTSLYTVQSGLMEYTDQTRTISRNTYWHTNNQHHFNLE